MYILFFYSEKWYATKIGDLVLLIFKVKAKGEKFMELVRMNKTHTDVEKLEEKAKKAFRPVIKFHEEHVRGICLSAACWLVFMTLSVSVLLRTKELNGMMRDVDMLCIIMALFLMIFMIDETIKYRIDNFTRMNLRYYKLVTEEFKSLESVRIAYIYAEEFQDSIEKCIKNNDYSFLNGVILTDEKGSRIPLKEAENIDFSYNDQKYEECRKFLSDLYKECKRAGVIGKTKNRNNRKNGWNSQRRLF